MSEADFKQQSEDYQRIERAILYLVDNYHRQPGLKEVAGSIHLSEYHFQRLFTHWVGISPKRFLQFLTKEHAKKLLDRSESLLEVTFESGLSSPGRLHDLFVNCEAVTPGEFKHRGAGLTIHYGFHPTPFGECLLGLTDRGICWLSFVGPDERGQELEELQARWRKAVLEEDPQRTQPLVESIFNANSRQPSPPLQVFLTGTNFQIKVWEALLRIPPGSIVSYQAISNHIGAPAASRAVGSAVARNPIAFLIPCHRVIRKVGSFGGYAGGPARKLAILGWEMALDELATA